MMQKSEPLRVFVAMPGTNMGEQSPWKNIDEIKQYFYTPICKGLEKKLKRKVSLVIEKDKPDGAIIHDSMFEDSWESEVYIADLSGNNANVYLELGVRWAVKDSVTIVVTQRLQDILFNADIVRAIEYSQSPTELTKSIERVIQAIISGIENDKTCLSPVRRSGKLLTIPKRSYDVLLEKVDELKSQNGADLLAAAATSDRPSDRLYLLKKCVEVNPAAIEGWLKLGKEYRLQENYQDSTDALLKALSLNSGNAETYRQLGITHTKLGNYEKSIEAFQSAIKISDSHSETWSNLGGALRRSGMSKLPNLTGWEELHSAKESYETAAKLDNHDTYALMNAAKLTLILSKNDKLLLSESITKFKHILPLCQYKFHEKPNDYWIRFDLADAYLLGSLEEESLDHYREAISLIPPAHRNSVISSVIGPLKNILDMNVVQDNTAGYISEILEILEKGTIATI